MTLYSKPCSIHNQLRTGAQMLSGDVRAFVESQAFTDGLVTAEKYDVEKARMTIAMLKCVALDPLRGADRHAFITQGEGKLRCNLAFDRLANFVGLFEIDLAAPLAKALVDAVEQNLRGRMFKAAQASRRIERRSVAMLAKAARRGTAAYRASLDAAMPKGVLRWSPTPEDYFRANAEFDRAYGNARENIERRLSALGRVASPGFTGGYTEAVAGFLHSYLSSN